MIDRLRGVDRQHRGSHEPVTSSGSPEVRTTSETDAVVGLFCE
jgi:hypothetical protein